MVDVYFIGVDVGTGSARAAIVTNKGKMVRTATKNIRTWNPQPDFYEQSTENIWSACVHCIKEVIQDINPEHIKGIGFDATCSLACFDENGDPLTISPSGSHEQNVILWMDHRAIKETEIINRLNHGVLKYVGSKISPEMETPKLMWLKNVLRESCWNKAGYFFDLPDFLTWKATGDDSRSSCSLVCKWTYEVTIDGNKGWNSSYFKEIGLQDLEVNNWKKIGSRVQVPGEAVGKGLSEAVAKELGLLPSTPVGTSIIDAHAGGLGLIGCTVPEVDQSFDRKLCLICGTSTCHMVVSKDPIFVPGVWGPYYSAMVPEMWLNEGGQSATGKLIDHVIDSHPATPGLKNRIGEMHIQEYLSNLLEDMRSSRNLASVTLLTEDLHVWPDFHGNRSPIANHSLKGMISGLTLTQDEESLARLYLATMQALAYGTRHILEAVHQAGHLDLTSILICGGLSKNLLFVQTQSDVVNLPVVCPDEPESVLLGSSILAACASNYFEDMKTAMESMGGTGKVIYPNQSLVRFHDKKYSVFRKMYEHQLEYKRLMANL